MTLSSSEVPRFGTRSGFLKNKEETLERNSLPFRLKVLPGDPLKLS